MMDVNDRALGITQPRLTARGARTRATIVSAAAELIRVQGVGATTLDQVIAASNVSKSQLYSHFPDKAALVREVVVLVGDQIVGGERERLNGVRTLADLVRWRDGLIANNALESGKYGCALGSLANEVSDQDEVARAKLNELFGTWQQLFGEVIHRFQQRGVIPSSADAAQLSAGFVAAVQGGYLLAQIARDVTPMAAAVDMAITHLELLARDEDDALSA
jgi:TetR/AcrR family transcriptional repressor of nem operon